jgi:homoserine dehydrogenase
VKEHIGIGIIGFGTVGVGTVRILQENRDIIYRRTGFYLDVVRIADIDLDTDRGIAVDRSILTDDAEVLITDPKVDIVVELIGGYEPAATFIKEALDQGKYVVTANKALLATRAGRFSTQQIKMEPKYPYPKTRDTARFFDSIRAREIRFDFHIRVEFSSIQFNL